MNATQKAAEKLTKVRAYQNSLREAGMVEAAVWLDEDLVDAAKKHAAARGLTLREFLVAALTKAVARTA